ncbi:MAG: alpha/beta hydrolase [Rhodospirillaceae bacterium]|nr:alpha/beta hydrolase [Rhodospirillaceae bacterium]MBT5241995.1 alpha/beta hydrolase [Rhodospirillaceae bacterium]MBT5565720.1 alpha/beta hydrolase [Rhodospirillaceae bacterium]MBT6088553.1 alpha/beta hydrolase [Rhodospirillaceae bacterium]
MRAALTAFALAILAACAPQVAPIGSLTTSPSITEAAFKTADGLSLPVRVWRPETELAGVVLAVHGFNDYSKSFDVVPDAPGVGPVLAAKGFAVYAYDQRGFGASPHAGLWPGEDQIVTDFSDFARVLDRTYPDVPLYAIGVSMGGAVIIAAMTADDPPPIDAAVLVAPAVWSRSTMPISYRVALWLGAHTMPKARPSGRGLGRRASDNIEMLRDAARDPLFIKETRIDSVYGLTNLMDRAQSRIGNIPVPTLYVYGANDEIIPKDATVKALERFLTNDADRRLGYYDSGWHMMLRDLEAETVLVDVASFLHNPTQPLPSGADKDALARLKTAEK